MLAIPTELREREEKLVLWQFMMYMFRDIKDSTPSATLRIMKSVCVIVKVFVVDAFST